MSSGGQVVGGGPGGVGGGVLFRWPLVACRWCPVVCAGGKDGDIAGTAGKMWAL